MRKRIICTLWLSCLLILGVYGQSKREQQVLQTMKTATQYMMDVVSYKGGFVWSYLPDMSRTWGEMEAKRTMAWIQPPGTPAVGHLMMDAYHATHDEYYYQCAERIANALIWGQLPCGGWNYMFDFAGENSIKQWYATIGKQAWRLEEFQHYYGNATFDDEGTMQAAKLLLRLYVEKYDPAYRAPLEKVIRFVLDSQYPIGGWPQRYPLKHDHPFQGNSDYSSFITLNDDVIPENIDFLVQCYQALGMQDLKGPIMRALNCVLALQQGEPYAGWADQYFVDDLQPAHARSYEPRSINTGTTAHMIRKLMDYYRLTGDTKFLSGIPAAIRFLESVELPASEAKKWRHPAREDAILVPRFIHPESGKPLYVHRKGSNVVNGTYYIDQNIENTIVHYSSATYLSIKALKEAYQEILALPKEEVTKNSPFAQDTCIPLQPFYYQPHGRGNASVEELVKSLSKEGYWLSPIRQTSNVYKPAPAMSPSDDTRYMETMVGDEYDTSPYQSKEKVMGISTRTFIENMSILIGALPKE
ncbi:pectate lyase [Bacteroides sp. 214]|uniref:pectate lyase n=1 Tax=Bacteroides sp. 214 TaxID=2302935 RepID=UPI0013D69A6A|nr:pectate lyase [Bacteroides sp. 214]NDW11392.1 pectate lyase [Bacteroides sp. 214]